MPPLVSAEWLEQQLQNGAVQIVDGSWYLPAMNRDPVEEYAKGHIPGAIFVDLDAVSDQHSPLPHTMPDGQMLAAAMAGLGIDLARPIVVYDGAGLFSAPRIRWMLITIGAENVAVLDGGLPAWTSAGLSLKSGAPEATAAPVRSAALAPERLVGFDEMLRIVQNGSAQVADARPAGRFDGTVPEPRAGMRSGHMPGATSTPLDQLLDNGFMKDPEELRHIFGTAGLDLDRPVVTSCGSGVTAAVVLLALEILGKTDGRLYDGSWSEWGGREDTPVVT